jgi:integrase
MLTDADCRAATCPADRAYKRYSDAGGLYLEVSRTGAKLWRWKYRFHGAERRLALGQYPDTSLRAAREARDEARALLRGGVDPSAAKRQRKVDAADTFEAVARAWWASWNTTKSERYARYVLDRLVSDVFNEIGNTSVRELRAADFVRVAKAIEERGAAELARRAMSTCSMVMRYAVAHGQADRNPVADVRPADVLKPRQVKNFARVDARELPELLRAVEAYAGSPFTRCAMKLMFLTFVRTNELVGARWGEFDLRLAEWRIPPERTKKRRLHLVPLSAQSIEVLRTLQAVRGVGRVTGDKLLFPGERDHDKPMSNGTILVALKRMGYGGRMTGHGVRGVASTVLHEAGFPSHVIEAQLAHLDADKTRSAYNHALYLDERRQMLQRWADWLDELRRGGRVVPLRAGDAPAGAQKHRGNRGNRGK